MQWSKGSDKSEEQVSGGLCLKTTLTKIYSHDWKRLGYWETEMAMSRPVR